MVPYSKELNECLKKACSKHGVQVYFKGGMTIKTILVAPNHKDPILKKVESYTDINVTGWSVMKSTLESHSRTFGERFKECQMAPSPTYDDSYTTGHTVSKENFSIVGRADQNLIRTIKEALHIRVNNPSLTQIT